MRPGHALVGLRFQAPMHPKQQAWDYYYYEVEEYDEGEDRLKITRFFTKGVRFKPDNARAQYSHTMDPHAFEAAWQIGEWQILDQGGLECMECGENPCSEDDYICKWCRWELAWKNLIAQPPHPRVPEPRPEDAEMKAGVYGGL